MTNFIGGHCYRGTVLPENVNIPAIYVFNAFQNMVHFCFKTGNLVIQVIPNIFFNLFLGILLRRKENQMQQAKKTPESRDVARIT